MLATIKNQILTVQVDTFGAQLMSVKDSNREYLWQGNEAYWKNRSPVLFPYVGRMEGQTYRYDGKQYTMEVHGFARNMEFALTRQTENVLEFTLNDTPQTLASYPWKFRFQVIYTLLENTLEIAYRVENRDEKTMYYGVGAHPGFNVPMEADKKFEDYYLAFTTDQATRLNCSEKCLLTDTSAYALPNNRLYLRHDLFDQDALLLKDAGHQVRLGAEDGPAILARFPQMDYVAFWHMPKTDAPYVCIEPWCSVPGGDGEETVFEERKDLLTLESGKTNTVTWSVTIE